MMTRAELKQQAKAQMQGKMGKFIPILLVYFVCVLAVTLIAELVSVKMALLGTVITFVLTPPIAMGYYLVFLNTTYGDMPEVGDLFEGFTKFFGKSILLNLLNVVFVCLWTLLLVVPGIIKSYAYSMAWLVMAENPDMSAREALKESERIMKGHKMDYFVLQLSFILWGLLTCVTLGLAAFYVAPYQQLTITNFYHNIKGTPSQGTTVEDASMDTAAEDVQTF